MTHRLAPGLALATLLLAPGALAQTAAQPPTAEEMVNGMESSGGGARPGLRRSGAKGVCAAGEWVSTGAGARLSTASNLREGVRIPVMARFAVTGGNPATPDTAPVGRGLSLSMEAPGGEPHEFVLLNAPVFGSATLQSFMDGTRARTPDPATGRVNAEALAAATAAHPDWAAQPAWFASNPPPASFATSPFFGVNSFVFTAPDGTRRHLRWTFEPVAGRVGLTPQERQSRGPNFLHDELRARVAQAPAEWRVLLVIPQPGDPLLDATKAWPADRETVEVARLRITSVSAGGTPVTPGAPPPGPCEPVMFNPLLLPAGIEPSDDPILLVRAETYAISLSRRLQ
jgi:catalase